MLWTKNPGIDLGREEFFIGIEENFREILRSQYHYERHSVCDFNIGRIFTTSIVIARQYISIQDVIRCSQYTKISLSKEKFSMTSKFVPCICKYINVPNLGVFSRKRIYL